MLVFNLPGLAGVQAIDRYSPGAVFHDLAFQIADLYVSQLSRGRTLFLTRYGGARKNRSTRFHSPPLCLAAVVPAFAGPDIYLQSQAFFGRHR
jgi:hypothetical protein